MLLGANFKTTTALEALSVRYANDQTKYAALKVFSPFMVPKSHFKWYIYDKSNLRAESNLQAPSGTKAHRYDYSVTTASGLTKEYAVSGLILEKDARDFDRPVADLRTDQALLNMDKLMIALEAAAYTKISTTANYAAGLTGAVGTAWSSPTSTPIDDVIGYQQAVFESCGVRPNAMVINGKTLNYLKTHPEIVDRIKYVGGMNDAALKAIADLFQVQEITVSDVLKLTSNEGATDATSVIWGNTALLYVKNDSSALRTLSYGRAFMAQQMWVKSIPRLDLARGALGAEELESGWEYDLQFIAQDGSAKSTAGALLTGIY